MNAYNSPVYAETCIIAKNLPRYRKMVVEDDVPSEAAEQRIRERAKKVAGMGEVNVTVCWYGTTSNNKGIEGRPFAVERFGAE